jgi:hypothetical protein
VKFVTFQASAAAWLRPSLFWDVTQHRLVFGYVSGQLIGPFFEGQASKNTLEYGTYMLFRNVGNYQPTPPGMPEERRPEIKIHFREQHTSARKQSLFGGSL